MSEEVGGCKGDEKEEKAAVPREGSNEDEKRGCSVGRGGFRIDERGGSSFLERVWQKRVDMGSDWHCGQVPGTPVHSPFPLAIVRGE